MTGVQTCALPIWRALEAGTQSFLALQERLRAGGARLPREKPRPSLLELVAELARRMLAHCNFCRWDCRVDRTRRGKLGANRHAARRDREHHGRAGAKSLEQPDERATCLGAICKNGRAIPQLGQVTNHRYRDTSSLSDLS